LKNDGSIVTQNVAKPSRSPSLDCAEDDLGFDQGLLRSSFTLKSLPERQCHARHRMAKWRGLDYCSSNNSTTCAVQSISVTDDDRGDGALPFHPR
jgi:hypothetical protein